MYFVFQVFFEIIIGKIVFASILFSFTFLLNFGISLS